MKDGSISSEVTVAASHYSSERDYWLKKLSGELVRSSFPYDSGIEDIKPLKTGSTAMRYRFKEPVSDGLLKLSNGADSNLYMILAAAVAVLLHRYSQDDDIIIGTPVLKHDSHDDLINTVLALRNTVKDRITFKELLLQVRETIIAAHNHQNYPFKILLNQLNLPPNPQGCPLFGVAILLENIHDKKYLQQVDCDIIFSFSLISCKNLQKNQALEKTPPKEQHPADCERKTGHVEIELEYRPHLYQRTRADQIIKHLENLLQQVLDNVNLPVYDIDILPEEEMSRLLFAFNDTAAPYPAGKTIPHLFEEIVEKTPNSVALVFNHEHLTYRHLHKRAGQVANYLYNEKHIGSNDMVAILMERSPNQVVALMGVLKSGGAYIPIDPSLPPERLGVLLRNAAVGTVISQEKYIGKLFRLQWECPNFHTFLCLDTTNLFQEEEEARNDLTDMKKLWDYVAETAGDDIDAGGWLSSYTGEAFSPEEMAEYGDNALEKLRPLLHGQMKVLEIGCASGITMYRVAPHVELYYGTDLSEVTIQRNRDRIQRENRENITLECLPAHEIDKIKNEDLEFDLVIMNSVIQSFHDHVYLRNVLFKAIDLLGPTGYIFIGDVMDQDLKAALIRDLNQFKQQTQNIYLTKTDFSIELFVARAFLEDLQHDRPEIVRLQFSDKIHTVENECTKFRYDALMVIDKQAAAGEKQRDIPAKQKHQHDLTALEAFAAGPPLPAAKPGSAAYVMYTSGSTGLPNGVVIEHRAIVNTLNWARNHYGFNRNDAILQVASYFFDSSVTTIFTPLISGSRLVIIPEVHRFNLEVLKETISKNRITYFLTVPSFYNIFLEEIPGYLTEVRAVTAAGEDFTEELVKKHFEKLPRVQLFNEYGPTENSVNTTVYQFQPESTFVFIGKPIDNNAIYILARNRRITPPGVPGEIHISSKGLARGYLNQPELTAEKFDHDEEKKTTLKKSNKKLLPGVQGGGFLEKSPPGRRRQKIYRTGDMGRWSPEGNIEFLGRKDFQVKIRGFRIETGEIENQIMKHDRIKETVVLVRETVQENSSSSQADEKYICAYIVTQGDPPEVLPGEPGSRQGGSPNPGADADFEAELREFLAERLPEYMIPACFVSIKSLPLTPNGKIHRSALPDPTMSRQGCTPPRDALDEKLLTLWSDVLKLGNENIGIDTNFFAAGGNSLRATVMISRIHKELQVKVPLVEIFRHQTIREIAQCIKSLTTDTFAPIPPAGDKPYYNLSPAQKRLFILQQLDLHSTGYNSPTVLLLSGAFDKQKLRDCFQELSNRHEILRTSFVMIEGKPMQKINEHVPFTVDYYELTGTEAGSDIEQFIRPFDLSRAPLFRVRLLRVTEQSHIFMFDIHHIICDGASTSIFIKELMRLYQGHRLPGLNLQYKDFSEWQNNPDSGVTAAIRQQGEYWRRQFKDEVPVIQLPTDYPRPSFQDFAGSRISFEIGSEQTRALNRLALDQGATLFITLLALFNVFLTKICGQEDILVGTPIAGRKHADLESMIGFFVNTLVLRNSLAPQQPFNQFLENVKTRTLEAFANQDFQYEDLVEKVVVERDVSRNPLFDVMFALQNIESVTVEIPGLKLSPYPFTNPAAQFDLILQGSENEGKLNLEMIYRTRLFKKSTIERFVGFFKNLVSQVIDNPRQKISALELMTDQEKDLVEQWSQGIITDKEPDKTIHRLFEERAAKNPGAVALELAGETLTYNQLNQRANQLARWLRDKGVTPDTVVGLMSDRSFEMVIGILGILKAGAAVLPIDPQYPQERILTMLEDSGVRLLLTREEITSALSFVSLKNIRHDLITPTKTAARPQIKNLDQLPWPDRTLIDYQKYHRSIGIALAKHTVHIQATRGCPFNCAYCHKIWPKNHVVRSAENIFEEVKACYDAGLRRFVFIDDIFNLRKENSCRYMQSIIDNKMDIQMFFPNGLRGDILTKDIIDLMVEAGTVDITLALETASPRIQKLIRKNLDLERFTENIDYILQQYPRVISEMEMMIGFPTETEEEALMTMDFLMKRKWLHFPNLHVLKIYPNTDMYRLALETGTPMELIEDSIHLAFHELPLTLPFGKDFVRQFQAIFLNDYILNKERLLDVLPKQMKIITEDELVQKYDSYVPMEIKNFSHLLDALKISREELTDVELLPPDYMAAPDFSEKMKPHFPTKSKEENPFKILLLDLSQQFSADLKDKLYNVTEEPLGLMYLMTYLNETFAGKIDGKVLKSNIDFDSYEELQEIVKTFNPHLIGIRTLSYYREFFHQTVSLLKQWGVRAPIIAGGPYATSDFNMLLQDINVELVVLGEGEWTLAQIVTEMMANNNQLPSRGQLEKIKGITFMNDKSKRHLKQTNREIILMDEIPDQLQQYPVENLPPVNQPGDLLYSIYTSGSTGKPKSTVLEHRNLVNLIHHQYRHTNLDFSRVLQFTTISFDVSFQEIFSTLLAGGRLYLIDKDTQRDPAALFKLVRENTIKTLFLPASFLKFVLNEKEYIRLLPRGVRHIVTAGEQLIVTEKFKQYLKENSIYLHNHYGPAETHVVTALTMDPGSDIPELPSIGKPIANTSIYIVDRGMKLQPRGIPGELYIGGVQVGRGYLDQPELTGEKFITHPDGEKEKLYRSGDLAKWLPDGNIQFLGRIDHQVKIRGFRIEPGEIEHQLLNHKAVKEAVVIVKKENETTRLSAYVVPGSTISDDSNLAVQLKTYLADRLPDYMVPATLARLDRIPLTPNGKVDRKALLSMEQEANFKAPGNKIESRLQEIWAEILKKNKDNISMDDNFFALGGHSLNATILMTRLHKEFSVRLTLTEIFTAPTIEGLSHRITEATANFYEEISPVSQKEYYPLSSAQKRLFFLEQFEHIGTSYNMPGVLKVEGLLDRVKLAKVLHKIIRRHETLRTSFITVNNQPVQRIHGAVSFDIEDFDLRTGEDSAAEIQEVIRSFVRPFDLSRAPLLRVGLATLSPNEYFLLYDMHHIISDGTSMEIITEEFIQLYSGMELPALTLRYKDFSQWQNQLTASGKIQQQEAYWLQLYSGKIPVLNFPTDYPRPERIDFTGNRYGFYLEEEYSAKLQQMCADHEITLYMNLFAAFNVLLYNYTGQSDIIVGGGIMGRPHIDLQRLIGFFVNSLPMRNFPRGEETYREFLQEVKQSCLAAFENQDLQFDTLVDKLKLERDPSRNNPLFDVLFVFQNYVKADINSASLQEVKFTPYGGANKTSKFDFDISAYEESGIIYFTLGYCTALFKDSTAIEIANNYIEVLKQVVENPEIPLEDVKINNDLMNVCPDINEENLQEFVF